MDVEQLECDIVKLSMIGPKSEEIAPPSKPPRMEKPGIDGKRSWVGVEYDMKNPIELCTKNVLNKVYYII